MTTKTVNLFTFDELPESAKENARDWYKKASNSDSYWSECVIDEAKEQGENLGLDIDKVLFSGFWSQGDGACFIGSWSADRVKIGETAKGWGDSPETTKIKQIAAEFEQFAKDWPESSFTVEHSGHYSHEYCTNFSVSLGEEADNNEEITPEQWGKASDSIIKTTRDYMKWIYNQLEKDYEYQNSNQCVDESILANEYTFLACGKRED